jgi:hypothetical protein
MEITGILNIEKLNDLNRLRYVLYEVKSRQPFVHVSWLKREEMNTKFGRTLLGNLPLRIS